jgi:hypothetical protein
MNQPAFPTWNNKADIVEGMTLRDYFAAAAMQGLLSTEYYRGIPHDFVAKEGFRVADEMLKAREE